MVPGKLWNETRMMLNFAGSAGGDVWGLTVAWPFNCMQAVFQRQKHVHP